MRTVVARQLLPGATAAEAEALWLDRNRWPSFIDGFGVMSIYHGDWPEPGSRIVWDSTPAGRGRVAEQVVDYEPGALLRCDVEDPQLIGTQDVSFRAVAGGAEIRLELAYELKRDPGVGAVLTDLFFVRRAIGDALRRTLRRFAIELQADRDMTSSNEKES
jgi:hypothetical protein